MFSCDFELLTERLAIRCVQPARASELSALVTANQAHLVEWMPWAVNVMSADEYGTFLAERCALFESGTDMAMHLIERSSERLVGGIGLHFIDWDNGVVEIGYWLSKESCGAGLVTEAVRRLVAFVFGELSPVERVEIRCDAENLLSGAVALRCGFAHEATLRSNRRNHTGRREMRDTKVFAMLRSEYKQNQTKEPGGAKDC